MSKETVSERDIRDSKFKFVNNPEEELEFRGDGEVVFKSRWESCVRKLFSILRLKDNELECDKVVKVVKRLKKKESKIQDRYVIKLTNSNQFYADDGDVINPMKADRFNTLEEAKDVIDWLKDDYSKDSKVVQIKFKVEYTLEDVALEE